VLAVGEAARAKKRCGSDSSHMQLSFSGLICLRVCVLLPCVHSAVCLAGAGLVTLGVALYLSSSDGPSSRDAWVAQLVAVERERRKNEREAAARQAEATKPYTRPTQ